MLLPRRLWILPRLPALVAMMAGVVASPAQAARGFARGGRTLLGWHCVKGHGPQKQKGGLALGTRTGAFHAGDSGEPAIVPGRSGQSRLIKLVSSRDAAERMPSKGDPLSAVQIDLLKRWI